MTYKPENQHFIKRIKNLFPDDAWIYYYKLVYEHKTMCCGRSTHKEKIGENLGIYCVGCLTYIDMIPCYYKKNLSKAPRILLRNFIPAIRRSNGS